MTVAACLIVKNEGAVIARCLRSAAGLVQAVVIVDTGSTDDTLAVIRGLDLPVPIHLHRRPWKNFAHNRTELLRLAEQVADYLLLLDADQTVEGRLPELSADAYSVLIRTAALAFRKLILVRSALPWRYEGVVHEYATCERAAPAVLLDSLVIRDHGDGGRRPPGWQPRWEWDAEVLEQELKRDPSNARTVFTWRVPTTTWRRPFPAPRGPADGDKRPRPATASVPRWAATLRKSFSRFTA